MFRKLFFMFLILLSLQACQTFPDQLPKEKNGRLYGVLDAGLFPYKWWDYYKRALSFAEGGFWNEAELDMKEAVRQRGKDQRRARTYAHNFIDYFPHRELGIIYYSQGRFHEAVDELTASLSTAASPRTEIYLGLAKKALRTSP